MVIVLRRPLALDDVADVWNYIAVDNETAADQWLGHLDERLSLLAETPHLGRSRPELADGLRSFTMGNYVIYYQPTESGIELIRLLHGARDLAGQVLD